MLRPTSEREEFANTLRGVAALTVLIFHYCGLFWNRRDSVAFYTNLDPLTQEVQSPALAAWADPVWFNWGAFGVGLFFLISGFVIPNSLIARTRLQFAFSRACRLLPTYAAGFTITCIAVYLAVKFTGREWPYSLSEVLTHYIPGIRDHVGTRSIDGIIWTLEVEVKFYILAAIVASYLRSADWRVIFPIIVFAITMKLYQSNGRFFTAHLNALDFFVRPFANYARFIIFMFVGVFFNFHHKGAVSTKGTIACAAICIAIFMIMSPDLDSSVQIAAMVGYLAAVPTFAFFYSRRKNGQNRSDYVNWLPAKFFAEISYPLYVVHGVNGYLLLTALLHLGLNVYISLIIAVSSAIALAYLLHRFVERPTKRLSKVSWASTREKIARQNAH